MAALTSCKDDDHAAPTDAAWHTVRFHLQRLLSNRTTPSPLLHVDFIAARLVAERSAWASVLRADPPWGRGGTPAALLSHDDNKPLLPTSLPGSEESSDAAESACVRGAAMLLSACYSETRASAAACSEAVRRAIERYSAELPVGLYRGTVHARAMKAAVAELKANIGIENIGIGVLQEEADHQLRAACMTMFAGLWILVCGMCVEMGYLCVNGGVCGFFCAPHCSAAHCWCTPQNGSSVKSMPSRGRRAQHPMDTAVHTPLQSH